MAIRAVHQHYKEFSTYILFQGRVQYMAIRVVHQHYKEFSTYKLFQGRV